VLLKGLSLGWLFGMQKLSSVMGLSIACWDEQEWGAGTFI